MKEEYVKWHSPNLGSDIETMVYGHQGYPVLIFPSSQGRYYEAKDFQLIDAIRWFIEEGKVKVYCPDSIDGLSLYNKHIHPAERIRNHDLYDKFIHQELLGKMRHETGMGKICVTGPSFGAYHALNYAFRHPETVSHLFAMSGKYDIKSFMDGYYEDPVYFHNPVDYVPDSNNSELWNMNIVLGTGEHDICRDSTLHMSHLLNSKGIDHWLDIREGQEHDWPLWRDMLPHYLSKL
ncbi:alpha/beta hydrolase-fold protein [soil metagenome]